MGIRITNTLLDFNIQFDAVLSYENKLSVFGRTFKFLAAADIFVAKPNHEKAKTIHVSDYIYSKNISISITYSFGLKTKLVTVGNFVNQYKEY